MSFVKLSQRLSAYVSRIFPSSRLNENNFGIVTGSWNRDVGKSRQVAW